MKSQRSGRCQEERPTNCSCLEKVVAGGTVNSLPPLFLSLTADPGASRRTALRAGANAIAPHHAGRESVCPLALPAGRCPTWVPLDGLPAAPRPSPHAPRTCSCDAQEGRIRGEIRSAPSHPARDLPSRARTLIVERTQQEAGSVSSTFEDTQTYPAPPCLSSIPKPIRCGSAPSEERVGQGGLARVVGADGPRRVSACVRRKKTRRLGLR